jgi:hypothetical protein
MIVKRTKEGHIEVRKGGILVFAEDASFEKLAASGGRND